MHTMYIYNHISCTNIYFSVNLGIDPDTIAGITRNVQVYLETEENSYILWNYDPELNISSIMSLLQESLYKNCNYVNLLFRELS